ncbi:hypothetical protein SLS62_000068 [Diatrype stigma]|uniref:Protein kinase domain-containing protein n=1 Tax=Diatrype stigma TaxID=117547 RepID=A0AAN9V186_9PEZI
MVQHLRCRRVRERDIQFDSHVSGFVYKVRVNGRPLIKKEIPGPDTVEEFLYEVNALNYLGFSESVIEFYGVVVDDDEHVKGLLISYAEKGALIDLIYDSQEHDLKLPWSLREKWARQIVKGLADIHESGFVQGDFTLSNIVIDHNDNAKIIDINRRGCPVGWEPPEATPLIDSNQRISMYIGVKSDLYQLGMVLWALATQEDEPEAHRPLRLTSEITVPRYYRNIVAYCLHENPRVRKHAKELLGMFPEPVIDLDPNHVDPPRISVDYDDRREIYQVADFQHNGFPQIRVVEPQNDPPYLKDLRMSPDSSEPDYPRRGRSPPSPMSSNRDRYYSPNVHDDATWPTSMDAYADMADPKSNRTRAETPRDTQAQAAMDIAEQLVRDLRNIEEGLQDEPASERAQATGGESRTAEAAPVLKTTGAQTPANGSERSRDGDIPIKDDTRSSSDYGDQHAAVTARDATPRAQVTSRPKTDNSLDLDPRVTEAREARDNSKGKGRARGKRRIEATAHLENDIELGEEEDLETRSSGANYTHDRKEEGPTRTTEARRSSDNEPRSRESPTTHRADPNDDLMGVGSAYDKPVEYRQSFSDEDLGLSSNLTHDVNVTSMA